MTDKLVTINREGCSIRCRLYVQEAPVPERVVVCGHGFGGHKDNRAVKRFADYARAKKKDVAVLSFDWPCHGDDARKKLLLSDCGLYLKCVVDELRERWPEARLMGYASSFGGYLFLKYIYENDNPFELTALRCPAVDMVRSLTENILSPEERQKLSRGREVLAGFDRKIKIGPEFMESLRAADVSRWDFRPWKDELLILHGTKDEIVPMETAEAFAERNGIAFFPMENADHRFTDAAIMQEAVKLVSEFLE